MTIKIRTTGSATVINTDTFNWSNGFGGDWSVAANWMDINTGGVAVSAPGTGNAVSITGGASSFTNIIGTGSAAQLTIQNDVLLWGKATVGGSITLAGTNAYQGADLELDGAAALTGTSLNIQQGSTLGVGASSKLAINGITTMTGSYVSAMSGSTVQFGGLITTGGTLGYGAFNTLAVDGNSSIEIGLTGGAALGAITIDKTQNIAFSGQLDGNVVVNGTIGIQGGGFLAIGSGQVNGSMDAPALTSAAMPSISGAGAIRLSEGSVLTLNGVDSAGIQFSAPSGTLVLDAFGQTGAISGFAASDLIETAAGLATGVRTTTTAAATTLTFTNGNKIVGTLALAGNYTGNLFHFSRLSSGQGEVTLQTVGKAPVIPSLILGTAGYDILTATANNQTLTGLGGNDSLSGGTFTGVDFKDTSANLNGATIQSFGATDVVDLTDMSPGKAVVTYTAAATSFSPTYLYTPPTLLVTDGTHVVNVKLTTTGTLPPGYFVASSDGGTGTDVKYVTVNTDSYLFNAALGGSYASASDWTDVTSGAPAAVAPTAGNNVTIAGSSLGYLNITGNGVAGGLTTSGDVLMWGSIAVSNQISGTSGTLTQSGTLALDGGAKLTLPGIAGPNPGALPGPIPAGADALINGVVEVGGGSTLTGAGGVAFSQTGAASLQVTGGSTVQFSAVISPTFYQPTFPGAVSSAPTISVDGTSSVEVGTAGSATKGALTIDAGVTVSFAGAIQGNVVVNGTLAAAGNGGLTIGGFGPGTGSISGNGTLAISVGETLTLNESDSAAIQFAAPSAFSGTGSNGILALGTSLPTGMISGFVAGDTITVAEAFTGVSYSQGATGGTLTLMNGLVSVGTLRLAGTYAASQFQVQLGTNGQSGALTYLPTPNMVVGNQVSVNSDAYSWTATGSGDWTNPNNWQDVTTGTAATAAPGAGNAVRFSSGLGSTVISGSGSAASLSADTYNGSTIFTGTVNVAGTFSSNGFSSHGNYIGLTNGARFVVGNLSMQGSTLQVSNASTLTATSQQGNQVSTLNVIGGSSVQLQSGGSFSGNIAVDGTSTLELGAAGNAATGAMTIDSGMTSVFSGGAIAANMVVNGTLSVGQYGSGGTTIEGFAGGAGTITGIGVINLTAGDRFILDEADSVSIAFQPDPFTQANSGTLELGGPLPTGTIIGFGTGDIIQIDRTVTGLQYTQSTLSQGTLTLLDGGATVGTLKLAGSYTGDWFHVDVAAATGFATISALIQPAAVSSSAIDTRTNAYSWVASGGGSWTNSANWLNITTGTMPTIVPGSGNAVTIAGSTQTVIGGNGSAASLAVTGTVLLTGQISVAGQLTASGTLGLDSGAQLTAASAVLSGQLEAGGASTVAVTGTASVTSTKLLALDGSTIRFGGLAGNNDTIAIDSSSSIAIGAVTTPAAGGLTVASGSAVALTGAIFGSVTANGTVSVAAGGGLLIDMNGNAQSDPYGSNPSITGTGTLSISEGSTLGLGGTDSAAIQFAGPNATLAVTNIPTATISGFTAGDRIQVDQLITGLSYSQTTTNAATLTLKNGAAAVGTLKLAGSFTGSSNAFHLETSGNGTFAVITLQSIGVAATQPSLIQGTMAADMLTATGNGQTLSGLGGSDTLRGGSFTGVTFKDLTANLASSAIQNFGTTDILDFTDMNASVATAAFTGGVLTVHDGTHSASLNLGSIAASGGFHLGSDGATGTKAFWS